MKRGPRERTRSAGPGVRVRRALAALALGTTLQASTAAAANPCEDGGSERPLSTIARVANSQDASGPDAAAAGESGISGTGRAGDERGSGESGLGGTGRSGENGIGGTGRGATDGSEGVAQAPEGGIRGTGRAGEGGIGGTGRDPGDPNGPGEGGIGGTGYARGIYGTVTGYASVCVAGIEVDVEAVGATPGIGEIVEVLARGEGERVVATSIVARPAVVGAVESVDAEAGTLRVLGQVVAFDGDTRSRPVAGGSAAAADGGSAAAADAGSAAAAHGGPAAAAAGGSAAATDRDEDRAFDPRTIEKGSRVRVSGLRREDGIIVATRIDAEASRRSTLSGTLARAKSGGWSVASVPLDASRIAGLEATAGDQVVVEGDFVDGRLVADTLDVPLSSSSLRRLDVEGFIAGDARTVSVGSLSIAAPASASLESGAKVRVTAMLREGSLEPTASRPAVPPRPLRARDAAGRAGDERRHPHAARATESTGKAGAAAAAPPKHERHLRHERPEGAASEGRPDRPERPEPPDRPERPDFPNRPPPRPGVGPRPPRPVEAPAERPARPEVPERMEVPARPPERIEIPGIR